jgi:transposase
MARKSKYSPEVRERAVRLFRESLPQQSSTNAALQAIASKIGCNAETLRLWVRAVDAGAVQGPAAATAERDRIRDLERENRELKRANEILRKASAYFAQAELDRRRS